MSELIAGHDRRQAAVDAVVDGLALLCLAGVVAAALYLQLQAISDYLLLLLYVAEGGFLGWLLYMRRVAGGGVVANCDPNVSRNVRWHFWLMAGGSGFLFLYHAAQAASVSDIFSPPMPLLLPPVAAFLIFASGTFQLRERGLLMFFLLVRWRRFDAYRWDEAHQLTLRLKRNGQWLKPSLRLSAARWQAVEELLSQNGLPDVAG